MAKYYSKEFNDIPGYAVVAENGLYEHSFGGNEWLIVDHNSFRDGPATLLTFDLKDPRMSFLATEALKELPICSYINSSVMQEPQEYSITPSTKTIEVLDKYVSTQAGFNDFNPFPNPLPYKPISLRPLSSEEYPIDESSYNNCLTSINGGEAFIRVLNVPIWDDNKCVPQNVDCNNCHAPTIHIVSLGSENSVESNFVDGQSLYFGDFILYFFLCTTCLRIKVISSFPIHSVTQ